MAKILIIDDDPVFRRLLSSPLQNAGYQVHTANDGQEGVQLLESQEFDLIITDLIMPGKDGFETIIEITSKFPDMKVILVSGEVTNNLKEYEELSQAFGALHALGKPVDPDVLLSMVQDLLGTDVGEQ